MDISLLKKFPISIKGSKIKLSYTVKIFVHHDGLMNKGKGNFLVIPVTILTPEVEEPIIQQIPPTPTFWVPNINEVSEFGVPHDEVSKDYY